MSIKLEKRVKKLEDRVIELTETLILVMITSGWTKQEAKGITTYTEKGKK